MLTIAVSSRALFHLENEDIIFSQSGADSFNAYMRANEKVPLIPGVAFDLVKKLLALNTNKLGEPRDKVEVIILSRNSPDAGMRVLDSVHFHGLAIERAWFCNGGNRFRYGKALGVHLFLSTNASDVKQAINYGLAAATLLPKEGRVNSDDGIVRIAFDGDSVLFSSDSDDVYRASGISAFRTGELANADIPLKAGPFKEFLDELCALRQAYPAGEAPLKIALVTARGVPAHARVIRTLRHWGVSIDEIIFAGGSAKGPLLEAFGADAFFDDTVKNIDSGIFYNVLSGHVPFGAGQGL
jgi:5'-nucleotidase